MTTQKHNETMTRLAEQYLKSLLSDTKITLRDVSAEGIVIEADASLPDIAMVNALHALASNWGYAHGECPTTVEALADGFFGPAKRATLTFGVSTETVSDAVYAAAYDQEAYHKARSMLGDAACICDAAHPETSAAIRQLLSKI